MNKQYRETKLLKADEFSSVFNFRKRYLSKHFALHYKPNEALKSRLGLVVAKKVEKSAVKRNYMRRVLRELFKQNDTLKTLNYDCIVRVQKPFHHGDFKQIEQSFNTLLSKLQKNVQK